MSEYATTHQDVAITPGDAATAETIDLLIRHLETAKRVVGAPSEKTFDKDGGELALTVPDVLCTLLYAQPGTFCPLLYVHIPSALERAGDSA